jgi:pimeloyl-ACP methyl ester carboxylesterase
MLRERVFDTGVVTINYAEGPPAGPALVMLHGGGDCWHHFAPLFPSLVMRWHVYALDLRGHGKSGRVPGQYRPEHYVADVLAFLESQLAEPPVLFGHSLGGWVALLVAAELGDGLRGLILGDPPLDIERFLEVEGSEEKKGMWRALRELAKAGLTVRELAAALGDLLGMEGVGLRAWAKTMSQVDADVVFYHATGRLDEYVAQVDLDGALGRVACPALLLQGDPSQGGIVSDDDVTRALSLLPDGMHVQVAGAGHDLGLSTWEVTPLLQAVTAFLEVV